MKKNRDFSITKFLIMVVIIAALVAVANFVTMRRMRMAVERALSGEEVR